MGIFSRKKDFVIPEWGIDSVETISLGGIEQTILIQAENKNNPVLLFLHGGPSMPLPGVSCRGQNYTVATNTKKLVKKFVLVFWDQRGTGKSYSPTIPKETMTVNQFVLDASELTDYLVERFKQEKIFLAAHSWGTVIGLNLVSQYPHKFHSYVGLSQIISWAENDRLALQWVKNEAQKRGHTKVLQELESVGQPPYVESFEQWGTLRKYQMKYNSMVYTDETIKHPGLINVTKAMLQSPDYRIKDVYHTFRSGFNLTYTQQFIEDIGSFHFQQSAPKLEIPVTFIHGKKDVHVHGDLVEDYVNNVNAIKGKRLIWVDKSSHLFHPEDTKIIEKHIIEELVHTSVLV